jgi:non-heme chloroperoxidase
MQRAILTLLLLASVSLTAQTSTAWVDPSPHRKRMIDVSPDASVEVLDWGGGGRALVLLAQLGQTAHIYDDWAPRLASAFHVLGITRRGYGESKTAAVGYSMERLASDIVAVLDAAKVEKAVLVGNGFAGEEMTWVGARFPDHLAGLIYLDAAYDRTNAGAEGAIARRIPPRPPQSQDLESAQALTRWVSRGVGYPVPESEVRQMSLFAQDGRATGERTPVATQRQIVAAIVKPEYSSIRVPALAIYAKPVSPDAFPGCRGAADAAVLQACSELFAWSLRHLDDGKAIFGTIGAKASIVELPGASPFVFLSHEREVGMAMEQFLSTLPK